jgi:general secretion pathway protein G
MSAAPTKSGNEVRIPSFPVGHGYSLLETMTVIVVILTLASIATPAFRTLIVHGREAVLREDLFTLRAQIDRFIHDYGRGPSSLEELVEKQYMGSVPTDPFTGSNQTWQVEGSG